MRIAVAVFEGAEELDFAGPWEVLAAWRFLYPDDVKVVLVGESTEPVSCAKGMRVVADTSWDELGDVDVLVYPGGRGTRAQLGDEKIRARLRALKQHGTLMTSVCTGALVYADAGLLDGEGFQNAGSCGGAVVFVDQSTESVAALDLSAARRRVGVCRVGRKERESAVGAPPSTSRFREPLLYPLSYGGSAAA
jgi:putative intracellular protease/amidase